ncbi:uncharacterized protein VTP21DRAFT_6295 [Calcarisporiella thermophila]|uniref:uncharacterized protein n=1 Tax=Calcarisporiella thermophila TaxID=911321 RepID=UPI003742E79A
MQSNSHSDYTYPPPPPQTPSSPYLQHQPPQQYQFAYPPPPPAAGDKNYYQQSYSQPSPQPYYQHPPPPPQTVIYANTPTSDTNIPLILFIAGFCFPILWLVGSCYLKTPDPNQRLWARLCLGFFIVSVLISITIIVVFFTVYGRATRCLSSRYYC